MVGYFMNRYHIICMRTRQRLNEAIKQTEIGLESIDQPDTRQSLEQALESLEEGLESLDKSSG